MQVIYEWKSAFVSWTSYSGLNQLLFFVVVAVIFHWLEPQQSNLIRKFVFFFSMPTNNDSYFFHWYNYRMAATFFARLSINCPSNQGNFHSFKWFFYQFYWHWRATFISAVTKTITDLIEWISQAFTWKQFYRIYFTIVNAVRKKIYNSLRFVSV